VAAKPSHTPAVKRKEAAPVNVEPAPTPTPATTEQAVEADPNAAPDAIAVAPKPPSDAAPQLNISPLAAARTVAHTEEPIEHARTCDARNRGSAQCIDNPDPTGAKAQSELTRALQTAANGTRPYLEKRPPPELRKTSDGSFLYANPRFHAQIAPDGEIHFRDAEDIQTASIPLAGSLDVMDAIEKHVLGRERYSAEKRWFLDQTVELRKRLADSARASETARAKRALEQQFALILSRPLTAQQKRDAVFELWENCGDDADTLTVRGVLEALIRERMPEDGELGFGVDEVARRNHNRPAKYRFDPYRHG
jgi:hypothetical protein